MRGAPTPGTAGVGGVTLIAATLAGIAWAVPASATDLLGLTGLRVPVKLDAGQTQWRVVAHLTAAAAAGAVLQGMYSTTSGGTLVTLGAGGALAVNGTGVLTGAWTAIPAGAQVDGFVTVQGSGGNGVTAAVIQHLSVQFR